MRTIDKLAWLTLRDGQLLCVRSHGRDRFYLPGGKREAGESDADAVMREVQEELNVLLQAETLTYAAQFEGPADNQPEGVTVRLTCYFGEYEGVLAASAEIAELAWLGYQEHPRASTAAHLVFDWLHQQGLLV